MTKEQLKNLTSMLRWNKEFIFYNEKTDHFIIIEQGITGFGILRDIKVDRLLPHGGLRTLLECFCKPDDYVAIGEL